MWHYRLYYMHTSLLDRTKYSETAFIGRMGLSVQTFIRSRHDTKPYTDGWHIRKASWSLQICGQSPWPAMRGNRNFRISNMPIDAGCNNNNEWTVIVVEQNEKNEDIKIIIWSRIGFNLCQCSVAMANSPTLFKALPIFRDILWKGTKSQRGILVTMYSKLGSKQDIVFFTTQKISQTVLLQWILSWIFESKWLNCLSYTIYILRHNTLLRNSVSSEDFEKF